MTHVALDLPALLRAHELENAREERLQHAGFSGARISRITRHDGLRFILKRVSPEDDWIMQATADTSCREAQIGANAGFLPDSVRTPSLGAAREGDGQAILMDEISDVLLPQGPVSEATLDQILAGMARLHTTPLETLPPVDWCDLRRRLMLLTPAGARIPEAARAPVARDLLEGWRQFDIHASAGARTIIHALFEDPLPLVRALDGLPSALLHGDLKFDNIGVDPGGALWLIDWAMTLIAPPAVELGWFLAINSRRFAPSLDEVTVRYAERAGIPPEHRERHDALTAVCGLVLRGWRKALDAEAGESEELRWWCERVEAAAALLR